MDEKPLYCDPLWIGSKTGMAKHILPIICEGELDVIQLAGRGIRAVCLTGRVRTWPGVVGGRKSTTTKAWPRTRPRWYRRQAKRSISVDS